MKITLDDARRIAPTIRAPGLGIWNIDKNELIATLMLVGDSLAREPTIWPRGANQVIHDKQLLAVTNAVEAFGRTNRRWLDRDIPARDKRPDGRGP